MGNGVQLPSGRVIAVGRLLQASLFLLAIVADKNLPAQAPYANYALLGLYVLFAAAIAAATWNNWWLDARLAGPAHAVDILMFTLLVLATEGQTRPLFAFFAFLLLAAAIRWSWSATALTAILLTLLYAVVGLLGARSGIAFDVDSFLVRTGHLAIFALILIWLGANQWRARLPRRVGDSLSDARLDEVPIESTLRDAMREARAADGLFVWRNGRMGEFAGVSIRGETVKAVSISARALAATFAMGPFVYDYRRDRGLTRQQERNLSEFRPSDVIVPLWASRLGLRVGLAIPVRTGEGEGAMFLERVASLSTDHIELGDRIGLGVTAHLQQHALLKWADETAEARSRLSIARDLHDSVVQFLAGASFRLEAMKRSEAAGRSLGPDLAELKQLMLHEQRELRGFITALRSGSSIAFADLSRDLQELADRLSRHWGVRCKFTSRPADITLPTRLHLNALQLMREAVANAVRHAGSKSVTVELWIEADSMCLKFVNDGSDFPLRGGRPDTPVSLQERVEQGGGSLDVTRGMGLTRIAVELPIGGSRQ